MQEKLEKVPRLEISFIFSCKLLEFLSGKYLKLATHSLCENWAGENFCNVKLFQVATLYNFSCLVSKIIDVRN